ncbi:MAG: hypothetical protein QM689_05955 [Oscillospiraceae bacterium]
MGIHKTRNFVLLCAGIGLLAGIAAVIVFFTRANTSDWDQKFSDGFSANKSGFEQINTVLQDYVGQYPSSTVELTGSGQIRVAGTVKDQLSGDNLTVFRTISDFVDGQYVSSVMCADNRITYSFGDNSFALVYTSAGEPDYMKSPSETKSWNRESFGDGWYFFQAK